MFNLLSFCFLAQRPGLFACVRTLIIFKLPSGESRSSLLASLVDVPALPPEHLLER